MPEITKFYAGKVVLISGATGFMGKVLLEKMLCTLPDVQKIYLLLRPKKGLTIEERINHMLSRVPFTFNNIPARQFAKVSGIQADLSKSDLNLSEEDMEIIVNEVSVVIHMAASVRFDLDLKEALEINTLATKTLLEFCTKVKDLSSVVYVSTTFCNVDIPYCEEKVYDVENLNVYKLLDMLNSDRDTLMKMTKDVMKHHPNTYTFTKRLAEILVRDMNDKLPLCIVRPSIVIPAYSNPCKGWVDNLNGPVGLLSAVGFGVARVIYGDISIKPEVVPVDWAVNAVIAAPSNRSLQQGTDTTVFNVTVLESSKFTWKYAGDMLRSISQTYPQKWLMWYPRGFGTSSFIVYALVTLLCQVLPAAIVDTLLVILGRKPFLLNVQKRLYHASRMMSYFALRPFSFDTSNTRELFNSLTPEDQEVFSGINDEAILDYEYFKLCYFSTNINCFKDDGKSSFRYVQIKIYFILDVLLQTAVLYGLLFVILRFFGVAKFLEFGYWFST